MTISLMLPSAMFVSKEAGRHRNCPVGSESMAKLPSVFITAFSDEDTVERIHSRSQGHLSYQSGLSSHPRRAVAAVTKALEQGPSYPLINDSGVPPQE